MFKSAAVRYKKYEECESNGNVREMYRTKNKRRTVYTYSSIISLKKRKRGMDKLTEN